MSSRLFPILAVVLITVPGLLYAQVEELDSPDDFSEEAVDFDFEGPGHGAGAASIYSQWGISFSRGNSGTPTIRTRTELTVLFNSLLNGTELGSSANESLVIDLAYPAEKVGFVLRNGEENVQATVAGFDALGSSLGSVQKDGFEDPVFFGIGATGGNSISKVTISYGASDLTEEIDDLIIEYADRPDFTTYLAQVADGPIAGFGTFQTTIIVTNSSNSTAEGQLSLFDSNGDPLELDFGGGKASSFDLQIDPRSSTTFISSGAAPVGVGYARVTTNIPVAGTAVFRLTSPSGAVASEAGVGSDTGRVDVVGAVEKVVADSFDSGIAVVNISTSDADAEILLYDQMGQVVDRERGLLDLEAGSHTAKFLSDIFPDLAAEDFSGTIRIVSDVPMVVVIMRTANGVVISSLPVGSLQR